MATLLRSMAISNLTGAHPAQEPLRAANPLVLVVDDNEDTRFLLRAVLERRGLEVMEAEDGEQAIQAAERFWPDLILMDGSLPRLDGLSATRRIREHESLRQVPIIFLSGHATSDFRASALAAGCDDYLIKPIDFIQFDSVLDKHLKKSSE